MSKYNRIVGFTAVFLSCTLLITIVFAQPTAIVEIQSTGKILYDVHPWYGTGEVPWMEQPTKEAVYAEWERVLNRMTKWHFNTERLYIYPNMNLASASRIDYVFIDDMISLFASHGMKTIIDMHHAGWIDGIREHGYVTGYFGSDQWIQDWRDLATRYKGNPNVAAFELFNEPFVTEEWDSTTVKDYPDIFKMYAICTDVVHVIDPNRTVIWGDPLLSNVIPWDDLTQPSIVELYKDYATNMWFAFHRYPPILPTAERSWLGLQILFDSIDYVMAKGFNVWLGEFGPLQEYSDAENRQFVLQCINYCMSRNIGFSLWEYRIDHHCTSGLYDDVLEQSNYAHAL